MRSRQVLILLLVSLMSAANAADIGLSPPRLSLTVPRGGSVTATATVFSNASQQENLSVSKSDWVQEQSGRLTFLPIGEDPYSASSWITLSSDVLSVPENGSVEYRVAIRVPDDASLEGTYRSMIFFETHPSPGPTSGGAFVMRQRLGLTVYVTIAGTAKPSLSIADFYRQGQSLVLTVSNSGNVVSRLGGRVEIRDETGHDVATLPVPADPVQRGGSRDITLKLPKGLQKGTYVALALVKPNNAPLQAGQLQMSIP